MVTGAAGFIGSHFVDYVLENHPGDQIIGFDCLTYAGRMENLASATPNKRFEFVKGDIRNPDDVNPVISKVDAVINFAAETHVDRSISSSSEFVSTNIIGVNTLLEAIVKHRITKFHQISTDEVYGPVFNGFSKESDVLAPSSPYAASKAAADLLALSFSNTHDVKIAITRASNNYGNRQFPEKLIPLFIDLLAKGEKVPIYGSGENIREWIHVYDHVRAVDEIFRNNQLPKVLNIGSGELKSNLEITNLILNFLKLSKDRILYTADRKGHDFRYALDCGLLQKALNYSTHYTLDLALPVIIAETLADPN